MIGGKPIAWMQHGCVYDDAHNIAGYYCRVKEFSGEAGTEHEMIISTDSVVTPGPEQTVEQIRDFGLTTGSNS